MIEIFLGGSVVNWFLSNYFLCILKEDYMFGFFVKYFIKDLKIVLEEVEKMNFVLLVII